MKGQGTVKSGSLGNSPAGVRASSSTNTQGAAAGSTSTQSSTQQSGSAAAGATTKADDQDRERRSSGRGNAEDRTRGLDRADEVAGEHGKQARDNARQKHGGD